MSYISLKEEILDLDLCARCGACAAVCPTDIIRIGESGVPECLVSFDTINNTCQDCNICVDICPGKETGVPVAEMNLFKRTRSKEERWTGIYRESNLVSVTEPTIRNRASAGGAVTGLMLSALRSGFVEAVIVIGRDHEKPWIPKAVLTDDEQTVIECSQSTYCIVPNLHLLRDTRYSRIGVVGLACEIQAIRKMQANPETAHIGNRVVFTVEIGCASNTKLEGTEHLIKNKLGIELEEVERVRYRDGEYPGEFTVYTKENGKKSLPFFELVEEFKKFKTHRCLSCPDWWSGIADISVSDGDPNIYASSRDGSLPERFSMVVTRTAIGEQMLTSGLNQGILQATPAPFNPDESLGLQRKRYRAAGYKRKYPDRVPTSPVDFDDVDDLRDDDEIIASMSKRKSIT